MFSKKRVLKAIMTFVLSYPWYLYKFRQFWLEDEKDLERKGLK